jgi:cyclopropane fatty-acyl-phospholipid synthase-like methyltransferase
MPSNEDIEVSIQNEEFINRSVDWIITRFGIGKNMHIADFGCGMGPYATRIAKKKCHISPFGTK